MTAISEVVSIAGELGSFSDCAAELGLAGSSFPRNSHSRLAVGCCISPALQSSLSAKRRKTIVPEVAYG